MITKITIPKINDNDTSLVVTKLYVKEGDFIKQGDPVAALESSKGVEDLYAPADGYVREIKDVEGEEYEVGSLICYLTSELDSFIKSDNGQQSRSDIVKESNVKEIVSQQSEKLLIDEGSDVKSTGRAKILAREFDIDINKLGKKIVRSYDVVGAIGGSEIKKRFLELIREDVSFRHLCSELKIIMYRAAGFQIGRNVILKNGSLIIAPEIKIEDGVTIGENTVIECDEMLNIGSGTTIGGHCDIVNKKIKIGRYNRIMGNVKMDLSGGGMASSCIIIEDRCLISPNCYINACRPVTIKERTALSPNSSIYTHSFWHNVFEGYKSSFGNVLLEKNSWLGSGAQVLPGVTLGEGSVVVSGSTVVQNVPPFTMVGGVPAKKIKDNPKKQLSIAEKQTILAKLMPNFIDYLKHRKCTVSIIEDNKTNVIQVESIKNENYTIAWPNYPEQREGLSKNLVVIGFDINHQGGIIIDLDHQSVAGGANKMTDELRNYFRRQGIDFTPYDWFYNYRNAI